MVLTLKKKSPGYKHSTFRVGSAWISTASWAGVGLPKTQTPSRGTETALRLGIGQLKSELQREDRGSPQSRPLGFSVLYHPLNCVVGRAGGWRETSPGNRLCQNGEQLLGGDSRACPCPTDKASLGMEGRWAQGCMPVTFNPGSSPRAPAQLHL